MKNSFRIEDGTVFVELKRKSGNSAYTLVEVADLEKLNNYPYTWQVSDSGYAPRVQGPFVDAEGNKRCTFLHRFLMDAPAGLVVDHINHNPLDNRRSNLRLITHAQNGQNRAGADRRSKSGIRGVYWNAERQKWEVFIKVNRKSKYIGRFTSAEEAERAAISAREKYMPFSEESSTEVLVDAQESAS